MKKRLLSILLLGSLVFNLAACGTSDGKTQDFSRDYEEENAQASVSQSKEAEAISGMEQMEFETYYQDFAVNLLKESRKNAAEPENTMVSPLSVLTALTMTENGAGGETLSQMEEVLAKGAGVEEQNKVLVEYINSLADSEKTRINQANSIWFNTARADFTVSEAFLQKNSLTYHADIFGTDFNENTRNEINQWVREETREMIPEILDSVPDEAIMYLINAIAFEAEWETIYEGHQVWERDFDNGEEVTKVSMMYSEEERFVEDENTKGFLKPYKDGYEFLALLPEEGVAMEEYLEGFTGDKLQNMLENVVDTDIIVNAGIPKFSSDFSIELSDTLKSMGMELPFSQQQADFSGMGTVEEGVNIYIGRVLHKTHISVYEEGTKAAASTVVEMLAEGTAMMDSSIRIENVILDRPFVYAIVDSESRLPVFLGVVDRIED